MPRQGNTCMAYWEGLRGPPNCEWTTSQACMTNDEWILVELISKKVHTLYFP